MQLHTGAVQTLLWLCVDSGLGEKLLAAVGSWTRVMSVPGLTLNRLNYGPALAYMFHYLAVPVLDLNAPENLKRVISRSDFVVVCDGRRHPSQRTEPSVPGSSPWVTAPCTALTLTRMTAPSMRALWVSAVLSSSACVCLAVPKSVCLSVYCSNTDYTKHCESMLCFLI